MVSNIPPTKEPRAKLRKYLLQSEALQLIPEAMARKYMAMPLEVNDASVSTR